MSLLAHVSGGRGDLPLPSWLFVWGAVVAVGLAVVALRASWPRPRLAAAAAGRDLPEPVQRARTALTIALRVVGLAAHAVLLVAGLWGESDINAVNMAPVGLYVGVWIGVQLLSVLLGDVGRALNPFDTFALLVFGRRHPDRTTRADPGPWVAPLLLATFVWLEVAYHSPNSPRPVGIWLAAYTVVAVGGAGWWGRAWLRTGEGFGAFLSLVGRIGVLRRDDGTGRLGVRPPVAGLGDAPDDNGTRALVVVALGASVFDGLSALAFWQSDVIGTSTGWSATAVSTIGLAFTVLAVAAVWLGAGRLRGAPGDAAPLVPVAVAWLIAHRVALFLIDAQSLVAIASDPFGRGWDLFGTAENGYWFPTVSLIVWLQAGALVAGHVAATVVLHDRAVARERLAAAVRSSFPMTVVLAASAAGAMWLLLGV